MSVLSQVRPPTGEPYVGRSACPVRREGASKPIDASYPYDKSIQIPKRDRRHHEHLDRRDGVGVIVNKGPPALRRRPSSFRHVLRHGGLADIDAELKAFTVDAG